MSNEKVKVRFTLLYKSGHIERIQQLATAQEVLNVNQAIATTFKNDKSGLLTLGDHEDNGVFVRMSDLSMVRVEILETASDEIIDSNTGEKQ